MTEIISQNNMLDRIIKLEQTVADLMKTVAKQSLLPMSPPMYDDAGNRLCLPPHSALSSVGIDLKVIASVVVEKTEEVILRENIFAILLKYLSPSVITGGKGFIKPTELFLQFNNDIFTASPSRLESWPSGFYRDATTLEVQLFIYTESFMLCVNGLPGITGLINAHKNESHREPFVYSNSVVGNKDYPELTIPKTKLAILEEELERLTNIYF